MASTRRAYLRGAAGVAGGIAGAAALSASATAQSSVPEFDPDGVAAADFPEDLLREYQPAVAISNASLDALLGIYAWRATPAADSETDLEALYYWFRYSHQRSFLDRAILRLFSEAGPDAHFLDHEPVIVFRDPDGGAVEAVVCSGYHHFAAARTGSDLPLDAIRTNYQTHVRLRIVDPWHHYNFFDGSEGGTASLVAPSAGLENWLESRPGWYADGVFAASSQAAVDDPYTMREDREMWWAEGTDDATWARRWLDWAPAGLSLGAIPSPAQADSDLRV